MSDSALTILLAHGSSDPLWLQPFFDLEQRIQARTKPVRLAFMELASPSLKDVIADARKNGFQRAVVLPLFFAAGRHLRIDVPRQIEQLTQQWQMDIQLLPPIGEHSLLSDAIVRIAGEAIDASQPSDRT